MKPGTGQQFMGILLALLAASGCSSARAPRGGAIQQASTSAVLPSSTSVPPEIPLEQRSEAYAHYATGLIHEMNGEPKEAFQEFLLAAQGDPSHVELILTVAHSLVQQKEFQEASDLLEKSLPYARTNHVIHALLGSVYAAAGEREKAIAACRRALELKPDLLAAYDTIARLELQAGDTQQMLAVLDEAASVKEADNWFLLNLSDHVVALGRAADLDFEKIKSRVLAILERVEASNPVDPRLQVRLADGFAGADEPDKALAIYDTIQENYAEWPQLREKQVTLLLRTGRTEKAREVLEEMLRVEPANPVGHIFMGRIAEENGELEEAAEHFEQAIQFQPANQATYYDLLGVYLEMKAIPKAHQLIDKMRLRFPPGFFMEYYSALAFVEEKNFPKAIEHYLEAEKLARDQSPNLLNYLFYFQLGSAYERNGQYEECEQAFRKSIELKEDFGQALNYLGYTWAELGAHLDEAYAMIQKAVALEPENAAFLDSLAWVLYKQGKPREALPEMLKAIEHTESPDPTLYDHLGDIYLALDQRDKAAQAWKQALEIEPNDEISAKLRSTEWAAPAEK